MDTNEDKTPENQGFPEDFEGIAPTKPTLSREVKEVLSDMEKRLFRVQRAMLAYKRKAPYALQCEEETLRSSIAHLKRRWGVD